MRHAKTRLPTYHEIQELVAFLPRLYSEGFVPITRWNGGTKDKDGVYTMPWPEYNPLVEQFYRLAASEYWLDYDYNPEEAARMLKDKQFVSSATLPQLKTMLTFCVRGERFSDGHWASMIQEGQIRMILERLNELGHDLNHGADPAIP